MQQAFLLVITTSHDGLYLWVEARAGAITSYELAHKMWQCLLGKPVGKTQIYESNMFNSKIKQKKKASCIICANNDDQDKNAQMSR